MKYVFGVAAGIAVMSVMTLLLVVGAEVVSWASQARWAGQVVVLIVLGAAIGLGAAHGWDESL